MPRFGFAQLLCFLLLTGAFLVFGSERSEAEEGLASWYGPGFEGRPTASGEPYNPNGYTAAHKTLPFGTELIVGYGQRSVPVRVNDRGPFLGTRELDLSHAAARDLGLIPAGVNYVEYDIVHGLGLDPSVAQQPVPSQTAAQQPGFPQGVAQQPGSLQGVAQQPGLLQGVAQQPGLTPGAAQPLDLSRGVAQQPSSLQGTAQQPGPIQEPTQPSEDTLPGVAQQPNISPTAAQQPGFPQGVAQQPGLSQGAAQQPESIQGAAQQPIPSQQAVQQPTSSQDIVQQPGLFQGAAQPPGLSGGTAQQEQVLSQGPGLAQGAAQPVEPTLSQEGAQQPGPSTEAAQQPNPLQGAESRSGLTPQGTTEDSRIPTQPGLSREAIQQPELTQGTPQRPQSSRGATQEAPPSQGSSQGTAQQPGLTDTNDGYRPSYPSYPASYPAAQDEANVGTYVVQLGDTLAQIAARLGVSVEDLARYNGIADPNVIHGGQPLHFLALENQPVGDGSSPTTDGAAIYSPLETEGNAGLDVAGSVAPGSAPENGAPGVPDRAATSNGTTAGGGRLMLPATGGGGR